MRKTMRKARDEQGFSLVELIVVVIIIGILAGVAVPIYLNQRKAAWRSSVQSDVRNTQVALETAMTGDKNSKRLTMKTNDGTVACSDKECSFTQAGGTINGVPVTVSKGNTITVSITYSADFYTVEGSNSNIKGFEYKYESATGAMEWRPHKP